MHEPNVNEALGLSFPFSSTMNMWMVFSFKDGEKVEFLRRVLLGPVKGRGWQMYLGCFLPWRFSHNRRNETELPEGSKSWRWGLILNREMESQRKRERIQERRLNQEQKKRAIWSLHWADHQVPSWLSEHTEVGAVLGEHFPQVYLSLT